MADIEIRLATEPEIREFYGGAPPRSMKVFVGLVDGKPLGIAGVAYQGPGGPPFLFSELKPEALQYRKAILRGARMMLATLGKQGMSAVADPEHPGAARLLSRLGFHYAGPAPTGDGFVFMGQADERR